MLDALPSELRYTIIHSLTLPVLAALPATCKRWRAFVTQYVAGLLSGRPELKWLLLCRGRIALAKLQQHKRAGPQVLGS